MISPLAALVRLHELTIDPPADQEVRIRLEGRLRQAMSARLQAAYENALRRYGASALAELDRGICRGCYVRQPAGLVAISGHVHQCQNCGRLIYDPDEAWEEVAI